MEREILKQILDKLDVIQNDINELKVTTARIENKLDKQHIENINADNMLMNELQMIKIDQDYLFDKVNYNERELNRLKRQ